MMTTTEEHKNHQISFSVVIVVHDQAAELEEQLPRFLTLNNGEGCEVIVVDDASTDETPDVLKRMKEEYSNLYTTFLPPSVRNPSRLRLALTLGAKAAHGSSIVLADINRPPVSELWFSGLPSEFDVTIVYSNRQGTDTSYQKKENLEDALPIILKAERQSGRGHHGRWLKKWRGHYDAVAIRRDYIFDVIKCCDQDIRGLRLMGLRLRVAWNNLFIR